MFSVKDGLTRTDKLPQTYKAVPIMGLSELTLGLAVYPIQKSEAVIPAPPIIAGYSLCSTATLCSWLLCRSLGKEILSMSIVVKAARRAPAIAALKATPTF